MAAAKKAIPKVNPPSSPNGSPKKKNTGKRKKTARKGAVKKDASSARGADAKFPRNSLEKVLRIPRAIFEQNAGKAASWAFPGKC